MDLLHAGELQRLQHYAQHFKIGGDTRLAEDLATDLTRRTRPPKAAGLRTRHGAEIAQAHALLVGVLPRGHARSLRRHIGAQADHETTGRIGEIQDLLLAVLRPLRPTPITLPLQRAL